MSDNILEVSHLKKYFKTRQGMVHAVDDVSFTLGRGKTLGVVGESGCGKSTLLRLLKKQLRPKGTKSGGIFYKGVEIDDLDDRTAVTDIGFVMQNPDNQIIANVVEEDVGFGPENIGVPTDEIWQRVDYALRAVGMTKYRTHSPNKLSGGQKQRVAIARAIVNEPSMILADEPTGALDTKTSAEIMELFKSLNKQGRTVVIVTHDPKIAEQCGRVIEISDGNIVTAK